MFGIWFYHCHVSCLVYLPWCFIFLSVLYSSDSLDPRYSSVLLLWYSYGWVLMKTRHLWLSCLLLAKTAMPMAVSGHEGKKTLFTKCLHTFWITIPSCIATAVWNSKLGFWWPTASFEIRCSTMNIPKTSIWSKNTVNQSCSVSVAPVLTYIYIKVRDWTCMSILSLTFW